MIVLPKISIMLDLFWLVAVKFIHYVPNSLFINVKIAFRPQGAQVLGTFSRLLGNLRFFFEG